MRMKENAVFLALTVELLLSLWNQDIVSKSDLSQTEIVDQ